MHDLFYEFDLDSNEKRVLRPFKVLGAIMAILFVVWLGWTIVRWVTFEMAYPMVSYGEDWAEDEVDPLSIYGIMVVPDPFGPLAQLAHYRDGVPLGDPTALLVWLASYHIDIASLWWEAQPLQLDSTAVLTMTARQIIVDLGAVRYSLQDAELAIRTWLQRMEWLYGPMSNWLDLNDPRWEDYERQARRELWRKDLERSMVQNPAIGVSLSPYARTLLKQP